MPRLSSKSAARLAQRFGDGQCATKIGLGCNNRQSKQKPVDKQTALGVEALPVCRDLFDPAI